MPAHTRSAKDHCNETQNSPAQRRRAGCFVMTSPAWAANSAEDFVSTNIQAGFDILNDQAASAAQRRERFAAFLLGLTDVRRVALFMLGRYAQGASPADLDAYVAAYQDHAEALYQSYFARYAGQSLRVMSSRERAPGDYVVTTSITAARALTPMEIDFRVKTDGAKAAAAGYRRCRRLAGAGAAGQFLTVLAQNNGDIKALRRICAPRRRAETFRNFSSESCNLNFRADTKLCPALLGCIHAWSRLVPRITEKFERPQVPKFRQVPSL